MTPFTHSLPKHLKTCPYILLFLALVPESICIFSCLLLTPDKNVSKCDKCCPTHLSTIAWHECLNIVLCIHIIQLHEVCVTCALWSDVKLWRESFQISVDIPLLSGYMSSTRDNVTIQFIPFYFRSDGQYLSMYVDYNEVLLIAFVLWNSDMTFFS
jgi:hypothetical protein